MIHARKHIYEGLVALFITTLIVSNIASVKIVQTGPLVFDAGTILFPLAYIIGGMITEIYGFRKMRSILYIGIGMLLLTTVTFWSVGLMPAAADWPNQPAYDAILGVVWRIVTASIVAIFVGEFINGFILGKLKVRFKGRLLWHRIIGSSAVGSYVDTVVFSVIAFGGTMPTSALLSLIFTVYAIKIGTEILLSPLTMRAILAIKQTDKTDVYEDPRLSLTD